MCAKLYARHILKHHMAQLPSAIFPKQLPPSNTVQSYEHQIQVSPFCFDAFLRSAEVRHAVCQSKDLY